MPLGNKLAFEGLPFTNTAFMRWEFSEKRASISIMGIFGRYLLLRLFEAITLPHELLYKTLYGKKTLCGFYIIFSSTPLSRFRVNE